MSSQVCSRISLSLVKVDTVVPTAACHQSLVNQATAVMSMPTRSRLPLPVNQAAAVVSMPTRSRLPILVNRANKTTPVLPEHTQPRSLATNLAAPISDAVTARIQKRHQLTAAKLTAAKRPQPPVKATRPAKAPVTATITRPSTIPVGVPTLIPSPFPPFVPVERSASLASTAGPNIRPSTRKYVYVMNLFRERNWEGEWRGHISHKVYIPATLYTRPTRLPHPPLTPSTNTGPRIRTVVAPARLRPVYLTMLPKKYRGTSPYCGRYCRLGEDGKPFVPAEPYHTRHSGHGHSNSECRIHDPCAWATTAAEEGPKSKCSHKKRVHWKPHVAEVVGTFEPWNLRAYGPTVKTDDPASPRVWPIWPSPPPSPPPSPSPTEPEPAPPADTNFHNAWTALMDEPFPDDLDY